MKIFITKSDIKRRDTSLYFTATLICSYRILEERNLIPEFKTRVEDEINYYIDEATSQRKRTRVDGIVESILKDMEKNMGKIQGSKT